MAILCINNGFSIENVCEIHNFIVILYPKTYVYYLLPSIIKFKLLII